MAIAGGIVEEPAVPAIQRLHPIRTHLGRSIATLVGGLVVAAVTALALKRFYESELAGYTYLEPDGAA